MNPFDQFLTELRSNGLDPALDQLCGYLISGKRFHELFELRKIQMRFRLGLPVAQWQSMEDLPAAVAREVEDGLLRICRETGTLLIQAGELASGWAYLEPVGDRAMVRELLAAIEPTSANVETLIDLSIHAGIDPLRGFRLILDRFGTCSGITALESRLAAAPLATRREVVGALVEHVYQELCRNIDRSLSRERDPSAGPYPPGTLARIRQEYPDLTSGLGHHMDATHLFSTVRLAAMLHDRSQQDLAIELAGYGAGLHADFQFRSDAPFESMYGDVESYLAAAHGINVEPELARLRACADRQARDEKNLDSAAWLTDLLDQCGRGEEAIESWIRWLHEPSRDHVLNVDIAPSLPELTGKYGLHEKAAAALRERGDLAGFASVMADHVQRRGTQAEGQKKV